MKPEDIQITDGLRVLLGEVPWSFLLEVALRMLFLYALILVAMRLMGKRMASLLSRNEMAALVSLAATVGVPMQAPDRGLLPAVVVAGVIVGVQRLVAHRAFRNKHFEYLAFDDIGVLVKDGCMQLDEMKQIALPRERLIAQLRSEGIDHLGKVRRLYIEASGSFTIKQQRKPQPGLSLFPADDQAMAKRQQKANDTFACATCGNLNQTPQPPRQHCPRCGTHQWVPAVVS